MKTITNAFNVYKFDELSQEAKKQALENFNNDESEQEIRNNMFFEDTTLYLSELFDNVELSYSLSYCQGDGLSFLFDNMYSDDIINLVTTLQNNDDKKLYFLSDEVREKLQELSSIILLNDLNKKRINAFDLVLESKRTNYHYYHSNSVTLEITSDFLDYNDVNKKTQLFIESLENVLIDVYQVLCKYLEDNGYNHIYYTMDIEEFSEYSNDSEFMYIESGVFYDYESNIE